MKILVVGGGGREHALAWKLKASPRVSEVLVAPGNAGTAMEPGVRNVAIAADDIQGLLSLAQAERVDLTVVGPETALVAGIVDRFSAAGLRCFGPRASAARLEGSKAFAKDFMERYGIPTARYRTFTSLEPALSELRNRGAPIVIKADGLAAGKGVVVAQSPGEAESAVRAMLGQRILGDGGRPGGDRGFPARRGGELHRNRGWQDDSAARHFAGSQGTGRRRYRSQHRRNGRLLPAPVVTTAVANRIMTEVMQPALAGMQADGERYVGFLYAGLIIAPDGGVKVLEFNCRLGDPEAQPLLLRLRSDLVELIDAALRGELHRMHADWDPRVALGVVMAAGGYPGDYRSGAVIHGLTPQPGVDRKVFHAGTALSGGRVVTSGGRVLCATALGATILSARQSAYDLVGQISWEGVHYRRDIGWRAVERQQRER